MHLLGLDWGLSLLLLPLAQQKEEGTVFCSQFSLIIHINSTVLHTHYTTLSLCTSQHARQIRHG
jgi:hypothetical protein